MNDKAADLRSDIDLQRMSVDNVNSYASWPSDHHFDYNNPKELRCSRCQVIAGEYPTRADAQRILERLGWTVTDEEIVCPDSGLREYLTQKGR